MAEFYSNQWPWIFRILLALLVGSSIGWQRQMHGSAAGLRTHILVCVGAALLTTVDSMHADYQGKIAAAVVTGIGFLGAGTIIHSDKGDSVHGLTTAASVWSSAGIGIAIGSGGPSTYVGLFGAVIVLTTLSVVYRLEDFALRHRRNRTLSIVINRPPGENVDDVIQRIANSLNSAGAVVEGIRKEAKVQTAADTVIQVRVRLTDSMSPSQLLLTCTSDSAVIQATWEL